MSRFNPNYYFLGNILKISYEELCFYNIARSTEVLTHAL